MLLYIYKEILFSKDTVNLKDNQLLIVLTLIEIHMLIFNCETK